MTSRIFGVRLHHIPSEQRLRALCQSFLDRDRSMRIFTPNPEILLRARNDADYADLLNSADLALPDGTGVALVEFARTGRRVRRWPGVQIAALLLGIARDRDATVAFVGGGGTVAERAAAAWRARLPGLRTGVVAAGVTFGDDGVARPLERDEEVTRALTSIAPTIVLVGLGAPKQERWIARHASEVPSARIMIGVGGAFDMWAGDLRRAPGPVRRIGLEWLWRLVLEPLRWRRIVRATIVFPAHALTDRASRDHAPPGRGPNR